MNKKKTYSDILKEAGLALPIITDYLLTHQDEFGGIDEPSEYEVADFASSDDISANTIELLPKLASLQRDLALKTLVERIIKKRNS